MMKGTDMKRLFVTTIGVLVLLGAGLPGQCAWTGFGADAGRTGFTAESPTLPMSTLWKFHYPDPQNEATAAVEQGRVYFTADRWLFCLDQDSGARLWEFSAGSFIRSSPALAGELVVFGDDTGALRALDKSSGIPQWERNLGGAIMVPPLLYGGKIFVGSAARQVVALDPYTGETIWTFGTAGPVNLPLAGGGDIVFALDGDGFIYGLSAASGRLLWRGKSASPLSAGPVVADDVLCLVSGPYLYGLTLRGSSLWKVRSDAALEHAPAAAEGSIYMTGSDGRLYRMAARSGGIVWVYEEPDILITASPAVAGNVVLAGGSSGAVLAVDRDSGELLWKCQGRSLTTPSNQPGSQSAFSQPVFADGSLLMLSNDGNLTCFSANSLDLTGPSIMPFGPSSRQVVSGQLPIVVQARIFDEGSGLLPDSIEVYLDGEKGTMERDPLSGNYFYILAGEEPGQTVPDGAHTVTLIASDYRGNTSTVTWKFTTDASIAVAERLIPEGLAKQFQAGRAGTSRTAGQAGRGGRGAGASRGGRGGRTGGMSRGGRGGATGGRGRGFGGGGRGGGVRGRGR